VSYSFLTEGGKIIHIANEKCWNKKFIDYINKHDHKSTRIYDDYATFSNRCIVGSKTGKINAIRNGTFKDIRSLECKSGGKQATEARA
jgi:hypothetical protein